jgi:hypothetical protein
VPVAESAQKMLNAFFALLSANVTMAVSALMRYIMPKIENKYKREIIKKAGIRNKARGESPFKKTGKAV